MFRVGIVGTGKMGCHHMRDILNGDVKDAVITAVCDTDVENLYSQKEKLNDDVKYFKNASDLINSGLVDGIVIATPHYDHPKISKEALDKGIHVFCEKPAGVFTKDVSETNKASSKSGKAFQINFVMRNLNTFKKIKQMIDDSELGEIKRFVWILTDWYRTQAYYDSGDWRATWAGEGGGTLLNQNPHQLDLMQWMFGMPKRVRGFCYFGKHRNIEVEDEATAYFEYENGAVGIYNTSVGEFPGTNRLEIAGDKGKLVFENGKITFFKLSVCEKQFNEETMTTAGPIPMEEINIEYEPNTINECHIAMLNNWVEAATSGKKLTSPGEDGIKSLSISNAIYLSNWNDDWVGFPFDEDEFLDKLNEKIKTSTYIKNKTVKTDDNLNFHQ